MLGEIESRRRGEQQRMSWMDGNTNSMDMSFECTPRDTERQGIMIDFIFKGLDE